uniref:Cytochrome b n=1 Tax=Siphonodentalium lobatum TaxID=203167 RepID=Q6VEH5_9MOLL|nr:cytochrome b [Siphonodentalium lobatum]AAP91673.1 cytochrome b [Siphonodentalium lobatum]
MKSLKTPMAINLPTPPNISSIWSFGSVLGVCLSIQLITGLILSMHYNASPDLAFASITHIDTNVYGGWILRSMHANGASLMFAAMYIHIGRGIYYKIYMYNKITWLIGVLLFLSSMATAFLGYVLPWGQMSFWAATVITNLLSTVPYIGKSMVMWLWGGYAVGGPTLSRFFSLHFILPFVIVVLSISHLLALHHKGSSNPLGINTNSEKISFYPMFYIKDLVAFLMLFVMWLVLVMIYPNMFTDAANFIPANPLVTPTHIQPEWYFLFAYAILRSIPNKAGGALALVMSILILFLLPLTQAKEISSSQMMISRNLIFWPLVASFLILTWIGSMPVEDPYIIIGQMFTFLYFFLFLCLMY